MILDGITVGEALAVGAILVSITASHVRMEYRLKAQEQHFDNGINAKVKQVARTVQSLDNRLAVVESHVGPWDGRERRAFAQGHREPG